MSVRALPTVQAGWAEAVLPPVALVAAVLCLWELAIHIFAVPNFVLPPPSTIAIVLARRQRDLLDAARVTAGEVFVGFVLSGGVGAGLALAMVRFRRVGRAVYPLIVLFQTVPKVALAPLFILWFGYGLAPKVVLIVVIAFFPVALDMLVGLRAADPGLVGLLRSVGAGHGEILWRIQIPTALPALFSGLKIAVTLSVIGAVVGEFAGASAGLGYVIQFASTQLETPLVFAALIEISVLGLLFYYGIELAERLLVPWSPR